LTTLTLDFPIAQSDFASRPWILLFGVVRGICVCCLECRVYRTSLSPDTAHLDLIFYQGSPSHCRSSLRFAPLLACSLFCGLEPALSLDRVTAMSEGASRVRRFDQNLCVYIHCLHRIARVLIRNFLLSTVFPLST
jgi:hypothetical protein